VIGWGSGVRLAATALAAFALGPALGWPGAMVGALAQMSGVLAEAAVITVPGLLAARRMPVASSAPTLAEVWRFHRPLAATNIMRVLVQPLISAALARGTLPTLSLAAWPLVGSTALLLASATVPLQEVAIATAREHGDARRLVRFGWCVGLTLTAVLGLMAATPLLDAYLRLVLAAPEAVRAVAAGAIIWLLPAPLLLAGQSLTRGLLAARRQTDVVGRAMLVNLVVLIVWLVSWVGLGLGPGVIGAATGLVVATAVELAVLWRVAGRASSH
jgi:hypothetical protein